MIEAINAFLETGIQWLLVVIIFFIIVFMLVNSYDKKLQKEDIEKQRRRKEASIWKDIQSKRMMDGKKLWDELLNLAGPQIDKDLPVLFIKRKRLQAKNGKSEFSKNTNGWGDELKNYISKKLLWEEKVLDNNSPIQPNNIEGLLPWFLAANKKNPIIAHLYEKYQIAENQIWIPVTGKEDYEALDNQYWTYVKLTEIMVEYLKSRTNYHSQSYTKCMMDIINYGIEHYKDTYNL